MSTALPLMEAAVGFIASTGDIGDDEYAHQEDHEDYKKNFDDRFHFDLPVSLFTSCSGWA
jgi:hypothetical protein